MPTDYAIKDGRTVFDATLYTGTGNTANTIINAGKFKPDLVWIKSRSNGYDGLIYDSVRGTGTGAGLSPNLSAVEGANGAYANLTSYNTNGFSIGTTSNTNTLNNSGSTFVSWQWQAGQGTTSTNTSGSITSTVSVNQTSGFSVCTFNAGSSGAKTFGHGLSSAPKFVILKSRTSAVDWVTYHASAISNVNTYLVLNTLNAPVTATGIWGSTLPTSSVVGFTSGTTCIANDNMVAYCWAEVAGFSKFGSYTGNGSTDGPFVYLGFRPKFVLVKNASSGGYWCLADSARNTSNLTDLELFPNTADAEFQNLSNSQPFDFLSNGFKLRGTGGGGNTSGASYIYIAFAENPFKYSNAR